MSGLCACMIIAVARSSAWALASRQLHRMRRDQRRVLAVFGRDVFGKFEMNRARSLFAGDRGRLRARAWGSSVAETIWRDSLVSGFIAAMVSTI